MVTWFSIYSVVWSEIFGNMVFIYSVILFRSNWPVSYGLDKILPLEVISSKAVISSRVEVVGVVLAEHVMDLATFAKRLITDVQAKKI